MPLDEFIADKITFVSRENALKISRAALFNTIGFVGGVASGVTVGYILEDILSQSRYEKGYTRQQQAVHSLVLLASWALPAKLRTKIPNRVFLDFAPGYAAGAYFGTGLSNYFID